MPDAHEEWTTLLDCFESDLHADTASATQWVPAVTPIPQQLVERARDLLARQRTAIAQMERERLRLLEHLTALRRVPAARGDAAVYVDVSA